MICLLQLMPMWHVDSRDTLDTVSDLLYVLVASFPDLPTSQFLIASSYILEVIKNWLVGSPRNKANVLLLKTFMSAIISMHIKSELQYLFLAATFV